MNDQKALYVDTIYNEQTEKGGESLWKRSNYLRVNCRYLKVNYAPIEANKELTKKHFKGEVEKCNLIREMLMFRTVNILGKDMRRS